MELELRPGSVVRFLLMLVAGFALAHIVLLEVGAKQSILRFLSAVMLVLCSSLCLLIATARKANDNHYSLYWLGLALIFFFLAVAKETAIHEYIAAPIRSALHLSKMQFYAWAYGIVVLVFPMLYLRFLRGLPRRTIFLLILGGCIFVAGAFGLDLLTAYLGRSIDPRSVGYLALATLEDVMELIGIIVAVYGLLSYMSLEMKQTRLQISG